MTTTITEDCSNVTITSTYFNPSNLSVTLKVTYNCTTEYSISINEEDTNIVVTPDMLSIDADALPDGVYYFEVKFIQSNSTEVIEASCRFVNCSTTCLMLDNFKNAVLGDEDATIRALSFYALSVADGCTSCACSDLCTLYNATQLDLCSTNVKPCGCS